MRSFLHHFQKVFHRVVQDEAHIISRYANIDHLKKVSPHKRLDIYQANCVRANFVKNIMFSWVWYVFDRQINTASH